MIVIFLVLLMVNAVFGVVIAGLLINNPGSVVPVWGAIVVALISGQLIYKTKASLPLVSLIGVAVLYRLIWVGASAPITLPDRFVGRDPRATRFILLLPYAAIASLFLVW